MASVASSLASASDVGRKRAKPPVGSSEVPPPPPPDTVDLPESYKVKRRRYCRVWSCEKNPWPLEGTSLSGWHPLVAWSRGSITKPGGDLCKVCLIVHCLLKWKYCFLNVLFVFFNCFLISQTSEVWQKLNRLQFLILVHSD